MIDFNFNLIFIWLYFFNNKIGNIGVKYIILGLSKLITLNTLDLDSSFYYNWLEVNLIIKLQM